jgi:hypothetical protein
MQALKQIRLYCVHSCMNHQPKEVLLCPSKNCALFQSRLGKNKSEPHISASKQIHQYCTDCSEGARQIKNCTFTNCEFYNFRKTSKNRHNSKMPCSIARNHHRCILESVDTKMMGKDG